MRLDTTVAFLPTAGSDDGVMMDLRCPQCARAVAAWTPLCTRCGAAITVPLRINWLARLFRACPSCRTEEPLVLNQPIFGEPSLGCRVCRATWLLDAAKRELVQIDPSTRQVEERRPVEAWLQQLPPSLVWRPLPTPQLLLFPGETCFLRVERTRMLDPRPRNRDREPIGRIEIFPGIFERVANDPYGPSPSALSIRARGTLLGTDRRIVFFGDRKQVEIVLSKVDGVEVDEGFLVLHRNARLDTFGFEGDSAARVREAILQLKAGREAAPQERPERVEASGRPQRAEQGNHERRALKTGVRATA